MGLHSYGVMGVDWEERVRYDRLREERLARVKALLAESELGALLCFDMSNIRYITATHIGTWAADKLNRFCLLPQGDEPIMWDFGSAARHHQLYNPWLGDGRSRAGISTMRGAMSPQSGRAEDVAHKIRVELEQRGLLGEPVGIDAIEPQVLFALQREGIQVVDGQQLMQQARMIKTRDEITLLNMACSMVDAAYEELYRTMRAGIRENDCVALVNRVLYEMGSEFVEGVNAISGERCSPHPHVFTDRALRPGDPAYFDILHSYMGYRTCYYRTFAVASASRPLIDAYKRCRYYLDAAIALIRPGATTGEVVSVWPKAQEFGFPDEEAAFALQFGHGVGLTDLGEADLQPPGLARPPRGDQGGDGVRAGDLLARQRRLVGGADRGAAGRHQRRLRDHHPLPGRGPGDRRQALLHRRRQPAARARAAVQPQHRARRRHPGGDAAPRGSAAAALRALASGACAARGAPRMDRGDDPLVAGAAAQVAGELLADLGLRRPRVAAQQRLGGDQKAGGAEPALQGVVLGERALQRASARRRGRPGPRRSGSRAAGLDGQHQARAHRLAVELHGAGAADAVLAADVGAGQPGLVADEVRQQRARLDLAS